MRLLFSFVVLVVLFSGCASDASPPAPVDPNLDSDGDGFPDTFETTRGSDPNNATSIPDIRVTEGVDFTGTGLVVGNEVPLQSPACGGRVAQDTASFTWSIEAPHNATDVDVDNLVFTITLGEALLEADIFVYDPSGVLISDATTMTIPPSKTDTVSPEGTYGPGDYRIDVRGCIGAGDVDLVASGVLSYLPDLSSFTVGNTTA